MAIPFRRDMSFEYAVLETVSPLVRRIVARNPGPFTFHGTGTYVVGLGKVAVIDAGPEVPEHADALLDALAGEEITHQLVTHTHLDHSPAARWVRERTGARTWGFGPHGEGRLQPGESVEAGADLAFSPDVRVGHGDVIEGDGWTIECVFTPGHCSNHLCFALREEKTLFTGDHVMGWSTSVIAPPDGDMADYMASLELLLTRDDAVYRPTHGAPIEEPKPFVRAFIEHRRDRERQIRDCLGRGLDTIATMVPAMYADVAPVLHPAAARSVLAHLADMVARRVVHADGAVGLAARYRLA
jgi:glyoxylase-like metal-dependent hydrolase (beta-lactamase superfamily II)